jgi:hypothetical protein
MIGVSRKFSPSSLGLIYGFEPNISQSFSISDYSSSIAFGSNNSYQSEDYNYYLDFDNSSTQNFLDGITSNTNWPQSDFTFYFKINLSTSLQNTMFFGGGNGSTGTSDQFYIMYDHANNQIISGVYDHSAVDSEEFTCPFTPSLNTDYTFLFTNDGTDLVLKINGISQTLTYTDKTNYMSILGAIVSPCFFGAIQGASVGDPNKNVRMDGGLFCFFRLNRVISNNEEDILNTYYGWDTTVAFGKVLHLNANEPTTINGGSPVNNDLVSNWNDISAGGNNANQINPANQPVYKSNGFGGNNMPYIEFDGVSEFLDLGTAISKLPNYTVIAVLQRDVIGTRRFVLGDTNSAASPSNQGINLEFSATNKLGSSYGNGSGGLGETKVESDNVLSDLNPGIFTISHTDGVLGVDMNKDGVSEPSTVTSGTITNIGGTKYNFSVGRLGDAPFLPFDGKIAEVEIWDRPLTSIELANEISLLKIKYGI